MYDRLYEIQSEATIIASLAFCMTINGIPTRLQTMSELVPLVVHLCSSRSRE
jgi:hypothetical protein